MIEIDTYLRDPDGDLVRIDDYAGRLPSVDYIEGALELTVDGNVIIDTSCWDYIDELWAYISNMIELLDSGQDSASTYFPDQPVEFSLTRQGRSRILVRLSAPEQPERNIRGIKIPASPEIKRVASADEKELIGSLRENGARFFRKMIALVPDGPGYDAPLKRLSTGKS